MSANAVSPVTTYFRVCDGVRVRFADNKADSDITVLLLAPVARNPLGLPSHLGPRCVSRAGRSPSTCRDSATPTVAGIDRPGRLGSVSGRPDRRVGPGGSARRRPGRRHGRSALPCHEGSGARYELDRRRRCRPLRSKQAARSRRSSKRRVWTSSAGWTPRPTSATPSRPLPRAKASRSPRGLCQRL